MTRDSNEWERAWTIVHSTPFKPKPPGPVDSHEYWQYMGTQRENDGPWIHHFRHRYHPATGQCERLRIPCRDDTSLKLMDWQ